MSMMKKKKYTYTYTYLWQPLGSAVYSPKQANVAMNGEYFNSFHLVTNLLFLWLLLPMEAKP